MIEPSFPGWSDDGLDITAESDIGGFLFCHGVKYNAIGRDYQESINDKVDSPVGMVVV